MNCFAVATLPVRVPGVALSEVAANEGALQAMEAKLLELTGAKVVRQIFNTPPRIAFVAGGLTFTLTSGSATVFSYDSNKAAYVQRDMQKYIAGLAMALRQQQIANALGTLGKVTRNTLDPASNVLTLTLRV